MSSAWNAHRQAVPDERARSGIFGYILAPLCILWCSSSASGIFVSILRMSDQRFLVAYPVGLFYACFALLSVFDIGLSHK